MVILGNFETTMIQKQSMAILVNYKYNYDTTTTTANKSMGFDLSAIDRLGPSLKSQGQSPGQSLSLNSH